MIKLNEEIPEVSACAVTECAYNVEKQCHARAITIGGGIHPACDTFVLTDGHVPDTEQQAGVGACKVAACVHNEDLECHARAIEVGRHDGHADCVTFEAR